MPTWKARLPGSAPKERAVTGSGGVLSEGVTRIG